MLAVMLRTAHTFSTARRDCCAIASGG